MKAIKAVLTDQSVLAVALNDLITAKIIPEKREIIFSCLNEVRDELRHVLIGEIGGDNVIDNGNIVVTLPTNYYIKANNSLVIIYKQVCSLVVKQQQKV